MGITKPVSGSGEPGESSLDSSLQSYADKPAAPYTGGAATASQRNKMPKTSTTKTSNSKTRTRTLNTYNPTDDKLRDRIAGMLNEVLANSISLRMQAKTAHWNVRGPQFIALHELFDKVASETSEYSDTIAERIGQMGHLAEGTPDQVSKANTLPAFPGEEIDGNKIVKALSESLGKFIQSCRDGIERADQMDDPVTADILTEVSRGAELNLWFVESHIQS